MTKKEKKQMEKQAEALKKARGKTTKVVTKKINRSFEKLANSVKYEFETEAITIDFKTFKKDLKGIIKLTYKITATEVINTVDTMYSLFEKVPHFPVIKDKILNSYNEKKAAETVTKINEVTKNKINKIITERQSEGINAKQIAKEVKANVKGMTKDRSLTIARTETSKASGYSMHELAKETLVNTKIWMHVGGGKHHRENHIAMDGEERKLDEPFSNGLMYAHESGAEAREVINCYCVTTYTFKV